jgi:hypothetical protein
MQSPPQRRSHYARVAIGFWLLVGLVTWNVLFDREIKRAENRYVQLQAASERGEGPAVTIRGVMDPAISRAVRVATGWSVLVTGAGLVATVWGIRRRRR